MKKVKELLFFTLPLIALAVLWVFLFPWEDVEFLRDVFGDIMFRRFVFSICGKAFVFSFVLVFLFTFFRHKTERRLCRELPFPSLWNVFLGSLAAAIVFVVERNRIFGLPTAAYDATYLVKSAGFIGGRITGLDIVAALQTGFLSSFLFWGMELLFSRRKKKDAEK